MSDTQLTHDYDVVLMQESPEAHKLAALQVEFMHATNRHDWERAEEIKQHPLVREFAKTHQHFTRAALKQGPPFVVDPFYEGWEPQRIEEHKALLAEIERDKRVHAEKYAPADEPLKWWSSAVCWQYITAATITVIWLGFLIVYYVIGH